MNLYDLSIDELIDYIEKNHIPMDFEDWLKLRIIYINIIITWEEIKKELEQE